jgi:hypothetical protein
MYLILSNYFEILSITYLLTLYNRCRCQHLEKLQQQRLTKSQKHDLEIPLLLTELDFLTDS